MDKEEMHQQFNDAKDLAAEIVDMIQEKMGGKLGITDSEAEKVRAALCIAFSTFCSLTGISLHESLEMVMTVYKNTVVVKD